MCTRTPVVGTSAWFSANLYVSSCLCVFLWKCVYTLGMAAVPVCLLTDSLLVNEQLSAITIHEPCHSPPLKAPAPEKLKPLVSH